MLNIVFTAGDHIIKIETSFTKNHDAIMACRQLSEALAGAGAREFLLEAFNPADDVAGDPCFSYRQRRRPTGVLPVAA